MDKVVNNFFEMSKQIGVNMTLIPQYRITLKHMIIVPKLLIGHCYIQSHHKK